MTTKLISKQDKLKLDLMQAEIDLNRAYSQLDQAEERVLEIKNKMIVLENEAVTECLPSHLLFAGYKLKQDSKTKLYELFDKDENLIHQWPFTPSLSDLMEIKP